MRYHSQTIFVAALAVGAASTGLFVGCGRREPPTPQKAVEMGVRFTSLKGRVQVKRAGTLQWIDATLAMTLQKDDLVQTFANATAKLRFADGTEFDVRPVSTIAFIESRHDPDSREPHLGLGIQNGEADFRTPAQAGDRKVEVPGGRAVPERETEGNVQVARDGKAAIRNFKGKSRIESRHGQQLQLGPNEGVQIDAQGQAGTKLPLPSTPALAAPPDRFEADYPDPSQATTLLSWNGVGGARSYRVVVDTSTAFVGPSLDRRVDQGTQLELRGLEAGTYYWKVAAVDASGVEGGFTSPWCFSLVKAQSGLLKPPQLVLEVIELRGTQLHVTGRTEPGTNVTINGERIPIQRDGSFNEHVALGRAATSVSIRATGANGAVTEQQLPIVVNK
jgi:hypothetical protein